MRRVLSATLTAGLTATLLLTAGAPAAIAKGGPIEGESANYFITNRWNGHTNGAFTYGRTNDTVYVGDWNGDRIDTLAVRRGATYHFRNQLAGGDADRVVTYGRRGDVVMMGDWNGDGIDTPVVRRGSVYHFKNSLRGGNADRVINYGRPGDEVIIGDWNGDGRDTLAVRRGSVYHVKNRIAGGNADVVVNYGRAGDDVVVGDWNGDGRDTLGVRRGNTFHIKNRIAGGNADRVMNYGWSIDGVMVGDWDGDGKDSVGLRTIRPLISHMPLSAFDQQMFDLINAERAKRGLVRLKPWPGLRDSAMRHSKWMADTGRYEHRPYEVMASDVRRGGCVYVGENIWTGRLLFHVDPHLGMELYMNSPGHRAAILNPKARYVGVATADNGVEYRDGLFYNTMRFATSCR